MLVNQGKFERDIDDCSSKISDCFTIFAVSTLRLDCERDGVMIFQTASQMELLVQCQEEVGREKNGLKGGRDGDCHRKTSLLREFDGVKFMLARIVTNMVMHSRPYPFYCFKSGARSPLWPSE
jgi:hypothetical protein